MSSSYVKNAWKDHDKVDDFANDIFVKLGLGSVYDYMSWKVEGNKFMLISDCRECQCANVDWFPVEWLDLPEDELVKRYFEESKNPDKCKLIGHE